MAAGKEVDSSQLGTRDPLDRLQVLLPSFLDDIRGQRRRWAVLVPCRRFQPVANELLVERRLTLSSRVQVAGPEARAVGRQNLVDQNQFVVGQMSPFELGIRNDYPAAPSVLRRATIDVQASRPKFVGNTLPDGCSHLIE